MKNVIITLGLSLMMLISSVSFSQVNSVTVEMGQGYGQDIYYSFKNGEVAQVDRTNWDLAFYTSPWSAAILTNGAAGTDGVALYTYPNSDTSGWSTMDTTGLSTWTAMYNSPDEWEEGAFSQNALGHPDYGWGKYNTVTHDVIGDSLYIIQLADGTVKKLWIQRKNSINNIFYFKFANLDNSDETAVELNCTDYTTKNFVYYSLADKAVVDREPANDSWDILFTKYMSIQSPGVYYPVTGVLNNVGVAANKFMEVGPNYDDWTAMPMDTARSPIGWDWKEFEFATFEWTVVDSLAYFVQTQNDGVYKLVFTNFEGTGTGIIGFDTKMVSATGIDDPATGLKELNFYPNPASGQLNVILPEFKGAAELVLHSLNGQKIMTETVTSNMAGNSFSIDVKDVLPGLYVIRIISGNEAWTGKVTIVR